MHTICRVDGPIVRVRLTKCRTHIFHPLDSLFYTYYYCCWTSARAAHHHHTGRHTISVCRTPQSPQPLLPHSAGPHIREKRETKDAECWPRPNHLLNNPNNRIGNGPKSRDRFIYTVCGWLAISGASLGAITKHIHYICVRCFRYMNNKQYNK